MSNKTHGHFRDIIAFANPDLRPVCESLRALIALLHGDFVEIVWPNHGIASYGVGPKKMTEHYAYIGVQNSHVNLGFYHGATLHDPHRLLEGTGKKLRHVKMPGVAVVEAAGLAALLREAIADRVRLAPAGSLAEPKGC